MYVPNIVQNVLILKKKRIIWYYKLTGCPVFLSGNPIINRSQMSFGFTVTQYFLEDVPLKWLWCFLLKPLMLNSFLFLCVWFIYGNVTIGQWVPKRDSFTPQGHIWQGLEKFLVITRGGVLMGRGQGCCLISYNTQNNPQNKEFNLA